MPISIVTQRLLMSFNRRQFLSGITATALAQRSSARPPNIIVILSDDQGSRDLGFLGAKDLKTPHLDAMAASGMHFTNWYANAPMCAPSRAGLLTGRHPIRAGVPSNGPNLPLEEHTIAALLRRQGYATGLVGKWHLGDQHASSPNQHGFDSFFGFHSGCVDYYSHRFYWGEPRRPNYHDLWRNGTEVFADGEYLTTRLASEAVKFIRDHQAQPFFLFLTFNAPHYPMHAPAEYVNRFPQLPLERRTYAAMMAAMDDGVGAVRSTLRELQLESNTLLFFLADNGATREARAGLDGKPATAGDNGVRRGFKFSAFDGGIHVPAIVSWPGVIQPGKVSEQLGSHFDVLPTILELTGARPAKPLDGVSLLSVLKGGAVKPRPPLFWASQGQLAMRKENWKLVVKGFAADGTPDGAKPLTGEDAVFLSDLAQDPGESTNLRLINPKVVDEMMTAAEAWKREISKE
ncbi:MAG: sulfatase-like hydrolase/transferase [Bryobacteraceae bacterium]